MMRRSYQLIIRSNRELVTRVNSSEAIKTSETQVLTLDPNGFKGKS